MPLINVSVIHRLSHGSLNRLLRPIKFFTETKSFHSVSNLNSCLLSKSGKACQPLNIVRWQFDFSKTPPKIERRSEWFSGKRKLPRTSKERNLTTLLYLVSLAVLTTGASYAAVPLYRIFCQVVLSSINNFVLGQ